MSLDTTLPVRVYWNVHRRCYSVQQKDGNRWKVVDHCDRLTLKNVTTIVSQSGIEKIRATGRKRVVAWLGGDVATQDDVDAVYRRDHSGPVIINRRRVWFDPRHYNQFQYSCDVGCSMNWFGSRTGYLELRTRMDHSRAGSHRNAMLWWVY